jgi:DnaK suppressor protein
MTPDLQIGDTREEADFEGVGEALLQERTAEFQALLFEERAKIFQNAQRTLTEEMTIDSDELSDDIDRASVDQSQNLTFRLRRRERMLLDKIEQSLQRLQSGDYWWCDECDAWIGFRRLRARPVTTLCIICKEKRERKERSQVR